MTLLILILLGVALYVSWTVATAYRRLAERVDDIHTTLQERCKLSAGAAESFDLPKGSEIFKGVSSSLARIAERITKTA